VEQPELVELTDVREIPRKRRLQRRVLARELLVGERLQQRLALLPRAHEHERELRL